MLDAGALRHEREPLRRALGGQQGEHVHQRLAALVQPPGVREGTRHRTEQLGALLALGVGEEPGARRVPAGGGRRGRVGGGVGGLAQQLDRAGVAGARALLDVERAHRVLP